MWRFFLKSSVLCRHFCVEKPSLNQQMGHKQLNLFAEFFRMEFQEANPMQLHAGVTGNGREPSGCPGTPHATIEKY